MKILKKCVFFLCILLILALAGTWFMGLISSWHVSPKPEEGQMRIACVGDSITYGCMVPGQAWNNYPRRLQKLLGEDYCVGNFGYSSRTASKSGDYPYTAEKLYQQSLDFQPDAVILMLGTNDSKEWNWDPDVYRRDLTDLVNSYRGLDSTPQIWLVLPPPVFPKGDKVLYGIRGEIIDSEICSIIREVGETEGLPVIDMHERFEGRGDLFLDGVHPDALGAKRFAGTVFDAICNDLIP